MCEIMDSLIFSCMNIMHFAHIHGPIAFRCSPLSHFCYFSPKLFLFCIYVSDSGDSQLNRSHLGDKPPAYQGGDILVHLIDIGRPTLKERSRIPWAWVLKYI